MLSTISLIVCLFFFFSFLDLKLLTKISLPLVKNIAYELMEFQHCNCNNVHYYDPQIMPFLDCFVAGKIGLGLFI